jgi:hypothetical protein
MRPGEVFTVATRADPENAPFNVVVHGQGISVWVNAGLDAEVVRLVGGPLGGFLLGACGIRWLICADMALVIAQTALQPVIPGAALGRVSAVFLTAHPAKYA